MNDRAARSEITRHTVDPPREHSAHAFHWAYRESDGAWLVFRVRDGVLWNSLGSVWNAPTLYEKGWRYAGPAIPPGPPKIIRKSETEAIGEMSEAEWERHVRRVGTQGNQPRTA